MALERISLVTRRSDSVENKPSAMACNTSGLIPVASTNRVVPSSQNQSTLCSAGTDARISATCTYQMFRSDIVTLNSHELYGKQRSNVADGSLGGGRSKSSLLLRRSSSSLVRVTSSVISNPSNIKSIEQRESLFRQFRGTLCLNLASTSDSNGPELARPRARKMKRTHYLAYSTSLCQLFMVKAEITLLTGSGMRSINLPKVYSNSNTLHSTVPNANRTRYRPSTVRCRRAFQFVCEAVFIHLPPQYPRRYP
jgi:hypothetical protein